jgi:hypothetical protein
MSCIQLELSNSGSLLALSCGKAKEVGPKIGPSLPANQNRPHMVTHSFKWSIVASELYAKWSLKCTKV